MESRKQFADYMDLICVFPYLGAEPIKIVIRSNHETEVKKRMFNKNDKLTLSCILLVAFLSIKILKNFIDSNVCESALFLSVILVMTCSCL